MNYKYFTLPILLLLFFYTCEDYTPCGIDPSDDEYATSINLYNDVLYVVGDNDEWVNESIVHSHLDILDISDINSPIKSGRIASINGRTIRHHQNCLFVCDRVRGIIIYDISNPFTPVEMALVPIELFESIFIEEIAFSNDYLYAANASAGMVIIDLSNIRSPKIINYFDEYPVYNLDIEDSLAVLSAGYNGFIVVSIADPLNLKVEAVEYTHNAQDVIINNNVVYVADSINGLLTFDITDLNDIKQVNHIGTKGDSIRLFCLNEYLYEIDFHNGIHVFHIGDPFNPSVEGRFFINQETGEPYNEDNYDAYYDIVVEDTFIFLADMLNGIDILDITDLNNIYRLHEIDTHK